MANLYAASGIPKYNIDPNIDTKGMAALYKASGIPQYH